MSIITLTVTHYEGGMTGFDQFKPSKNNASAYSEISDLFRDYDDQF